jgi:GNAT superfamily N-acetyltransferase
LKALGIGQRTYPSLKIARLGVSKDEWNKGIGSFIVKHTIGTGLLQSETVGCRYLTVDAYNKDIPINFYLHKGFKKLVKETDKENIPMYLDLQEWSKD